MNPPTVGNTNPGDNQDTTKKLEEDIRSGERWLIRIGVAALLINTIIAAIYILQLNQMRLATQASTDAVRLANETLQYNASQFDRGMRQTIGQGSTQYRATQESIVAANAAKSAADTANATLKQSQEQFIQEQRPYVYLLPGSLQATVGDRMRMAITEVNYGKVPAQHAKSVGAILHGPNALQMADQWFMSVA